VSYHETMKPKVYTFTMLTGLGLKIHPTKGHFDPILIGEHMGMIIDMQVRQFVAPTAKLKQIATMAKTLLCRAAAHKRWFSVKTLASLVGKAHFLHLAIFVARFFLRELHDVVGSAKCWSGTVRVTPQLKRDLEWRTHVPDYKNGAPIWKPIENAYLHCDSSDYG